MIPRPFQISPAAFRVAILAILWLGLISLLHGYLNAEPRSPERIRMGYMPVITNLAAPLVDAASKGSDIRFEAIKFPSFAEMAEAFRSGHIQAAFIIAPLSIALYQQGVPLKVVYIGNRHESTLVVNKNITCKTLSDMTGKTIAVPIRYSGHLLALKRYLREHGMDPQDIRTLEIPPPDMPAALASGGIDGYFVGEPFACKVLHGNVATRLLNVEDIWPRFICNLMIVREELIRSHPEWIQALVTASARSGFWAQSHVEETVQLASRYWGQDPEMVRYTFLNPPDRFRFDLYTPVVEEMEEIAQEMRRAGLLEGEVDLRGLVDDRFAKEVQMESVGSFQDILPRRIEKGRETS